MRDAGWERGDLGDLENCEGRGPSETRCARDVSGSGRRTSRHDLHIESDERGHDEPWTVDDADLVVPKDGLEVLGLCECRDEAA